MVTGLTAESTPRIELGKSGLQVSRIGIGTLQWGDPGQGFGDRFSEVLNILQSLPAA